MICELSDYNSFDIILHQNDSNYYNLKIMFYLEIRTKYCFLIFILFCLYNNVLTD